MQRSKGRAIDIACNEAKPAACKALSRLRKGIAYCLLY
jgi:hypothetical protein